jgi:cysteine dioxygenase
MATSNGSFTSCPKLHEARQHVLARAGEDAHALLPMLDEMPILSSALLEAEEVWESLSLDALASRFAHARLDWRRLAAALRFDLSGYHRGVLFRGAGHELLLASWLPGQASPIHDHGGSEGVTRILTGSLEETRFERVGACARPVAARAWGPGSILVERGDTLHQVRNAFHRPAVSLHLYRPPLAELRVYPLLG